MVSGTDIPYHHDTMLLVRKTLVHPGSLKMKTFPLVVEIHPKKKNSRRNIMLAQFRLKRCPQVTIVCTTAHLASKFFVEEALPRKRLQLQQIGKLLRQHATSASSSVCFHVGDTNLVGDEGVRKDNEAVSDAGLEDLFAMTEKTWDPAEESSKENKKNFQRNHATWRAPENPVTFQLGHKHHEFHRPDRMFITSESRQKLLQVPLSSVRIQKENMSDHDGLISKLVIRCSG